MPRLYKVFFYGIFATVACSLGLLLYTLLSKDTAWWELYADIFLISLLLHSWFLAIALCVGEFWPRRFPRYAGQKIAVLIPCYNEDRDLLEKAIRSVYLAYDNKEIILINDGSTNGLEHAFRDFRNRYGVRIVSYSPNQGKRAALYRGVKKVSPDVKFIVCMDSDTIFHKEALIKIVEPLLLPNVGAATGNIYLLNERDNLLTRMTASYYWTSLNIYKQAQSTFGSVACCSGCLSAFKAALLKSIMDDFVNQTFFGEACTYSEDRHLTNLVLKQGYNVLYIPEAIAYTKSPETLAGFMRQQKRWKRGFIRESVYTLTFAWKTHPVLFCMVLLWDLNTPFFTVGMKLLLIPLILLHPLFFLLTVLPMWLVFVAARYALLILREPRKAFGMMLFVLFYEVCLYWMNLYALFTVKNKSWVTR